MTEEINSSLKTPEIVNLDEIRSIADSLIVVYGAENEIFAADFRNAWQAYPQEPQAAIEDSKQSWKGKREDFLEFWDTVKKADERVITTVPLQKLSKALMTRESLSEDWLSLAAFLNHDFYHLALMELLQLFVTVEGRSLKTNEVSIFDRHKIFMDLVTSRAEELSRIQCIPLAFISAVASFEAGKPVPVKTFKPLELLEKIGLMIQGRFMVDDYNLAINTQPAAGVNNLVINVDPDLEITANEAMVGMVIYNLAKNAAKANAFWHHDNDDQALVKAYDGGSLQKPRTLSITIEDAEDMIILKIGDEGQGLSIDNFMKRIHRELAEQLRQNGPDGIKNTEWYQTVRRTIGEEQAGYLMAWLSDPLSLRGLNIGTIFDMQFVVGFSGQSWEIRSFTSGMGLWGVRYLTERLGGTVMGTNKFEGGALFSVVLPKKALGL